jgi:hypothetical protein
MVSASASKDAAACFDSAEPLRSFAHCLIFNSASSENNAVPCPFASKYTPTSNASAAGCRCFTPVGVHFVVNP